MIGANTTYGTYRDDTGLPAPFRLLHGDDVFTMRSETGQNRSPIDDLKSYILGAMNQGEHFTDPDKLTEKLLTSGSVVIVDPATPAQRYHPYVYAPSETEWIAYLTDEHGCLHLECLDDNMDRVYSKHGNIRYRLTGNEWIPEWLDSHGKAIAPPADKEPTAFPATKLLVIPNGRGVLYWAQDILHRMEEIAETERRVMSGSNLLPIISGDIGSQSLASQAFSNAKNAIFFPGMITVDRVVSDAVVNQLKVWYDGRKEDWLASLNVLASDAQASRPVASDRAMRMQAMVRYVTRIRGKLQSIYAQFAQTIEFEPLIVLSPADLLMWLDVLDRIKPIIGEEAYKERVMMLYKL